MTIDEMTGQHWLDAERGSYLPHDVILSWLHDISIHDIGKLSHRKHSAMTMELVSQMPPYDLYAADDGPVDPDDYDTDGFDLDGNEMPEIERAVVHLKSGDVTLNPLTADQVRRMQKRNPPSNFHGVMLATGLSQAQLKAMPLLDYLSCQAAMASFLPVGQIAASSPSH